MKLIVHGTKRKEAIAKMQSALELCNIEGVKTNLRYLSRVLRHSDYRNGRFDTGFLDTHTDTLTVSTCPADQRMLALATLYALLLRESRAITNAQEANNANRYSPWYRLTSWRINHRATETLTFKNAGDETKVSVEHLGPQRFRFNGNWEMTGKLQSTLGHLTAQLDGKPIELSINLNNDGFIIDFNDELHAFALAGVDALGTETDNQQGHLRAPMPDTIVSVNVDVGDRVEKGQTLLVLEAMKMEHTITAPADGVISNLAYKTGDRVDADVELLVLDT